MYTVLVLDAGRAGGINITRSLALSPIEIRTVGLESRLHSISMAETDVLYHSPSGEDPDFIEFLREVCCHENVDFIAPTKTGAALSRLSMERSTIPAHLFLPPHETLELVDDKWATYRLLANAGIPVPDSMLVSDVADLARAMES